MSRADPYSHGPRRTALLIAAARELADREDIPYGEAADMIIDREDQWRREERAARQWSPGREIAQAAAAALRRLAGRARRGGG
jgi:hypothetical protein